MSELTKPAMRAARAINSTTFAVDANEPEDIAAIAEIIDCETALPELIAALRAVRDCGGRGELDDGTSVSYLIDEALRKAGEL